MKNALQEMILAALQETQGAGDLAAVQIPAIEISVPQLAAHGDFATNIALVTASVFKMPPRAIAQKIVDHLKDPAGILAKTEIAGPGFINFFIRPSAWLPVLDRIHEADERFGASDIGRGEKVQVEFVSSNPTGPLHIGHGRGAAVGDSVGNILAFCGFEVQKEYYINDSGRQIKTLGRSVFLRYKEHLEQAVEFPEECYQGDYIRDLARQVLDQKGDKLVAADEEESITFCARFAAREILAGIRTDLASFGVVFDKWFSEQSLYDNGQVAQCISEFEKAGIIFENEGARWFRTTQFGDEKDRVVVRQNGETTYFASDIAYHQDKYRRGFERVIDVWGADHHGYIARMTAAVVASGCRAEQFQVILVQLVNLLREGEPVPMSTRAGEFVTLRDVLDEVGLDAARFIFLTRHYDSPLDFDLELAKKKSNDNPVYYVQYVHARISSILKKAAERGAGEGGKDPDALKRLTAPEEIQLLKLLSGFPETVQNSALFLEPHRITYYLMSLAAAFHAYYNKHRVLSDEADLARGRLYLITAVQKVIRNGLTLLGVSAPETM